MLTIVYSDLMRILKNWKHWAVILTVIGFIAFFETSGLAGSGLNTPTNFIFIYSNAAMLTILIVGSMEFIHVFGADLKGNVYPGLIGAGIPRWKIIAAKYLLMLILTLIDTLLMAGAAFLFTSMYGIHFEGVYLIRFSRMVLDWWLQMIVYCAPAVLAAFWTEKMIYMVGIYVFLGSGWHVIAQLFQNVDLGIFFDAIALSRYTQEIATVLTGNDISFSTILYLTSIVIGCIAAAIFVFRKKELSF